MSVCSRGPPAALPASPLPLSARTSAVADTPACPSFRESLVGDYAGVLDKVKKLVENFSSAGERDRARALGFSITAREPHAHVR